MAYIIEAACHCQTGKVRKNNEDNFYFDDRCLEADNNGLHNPVSLEASTRNGLVVAVFDGMGGEDYGEQASFAAATCLQAELQKPRSFFVPEKKYLEELSDKMNMAVVTKAVELQTERMGSTMVLLFFAHSYLYVCNIGDSRAYRLRNREFLQISKDHSESRNNGKKAPLTQNLGIDPEELRIEPHIAKGDLQAGDVYLICSDGLTDMLSNFEIDDILCKTPNPEECVKKLVDTALDRGGKDNTTVIVCAVRK